MKALLLLGNAFDFQVLLLTVHGCLLVWFCSLCFYFIFHGFFFSQSVCTSDLINAKAPGAFGTKPHILLNAAACPCISVLKSLYM